MKVISNLVLLAKGFFVGGTMLVPGCSGGTMCIVLGIYDKLINAVSSFRKDKLKCFLFLLVFCIGAGGGMLLCAKPVLSLTEAYPMRMMYLFIGAVCGGIPLIIRESNIKKPSPGMLFYPIIGFASVFLINLLPQNLIKADGGFDVVTLLLLAAAGFLAAIALILPGISVSYFLLILGLYDTIVNAVGNFDIIMLMPFGIGLVVGIVTTTKLLSAAMEKHTTGTYLIILGFVAGSVVQVFPGIPKDFELLISLMLFAAGFFAIYRLSELEAAKQ